jgi:hypothetical protein
MGAFYSFPAKETAPHRYFLNWKGVQPIEALRGTEKILKAALCAAFKIFSGF